MTSIISLLLDFSIHQWVWFLVIILSAYFVSWPTTGLTLKISYKLIKRHVPSFDKQILRAAYTPWRTGFGILFFSIGVRFIDLPDSMREILPTFEKLAAVFTFTWLVFSVINVFNDWFLEELTIRGKLTVTTMLPLFRRAIKTTVILLAVVALLQNIGINVSALLTGLGVGGIAVALAAQKTLENVFGGIMLVLDQPIRVGDTCKIGEQQGVILDIGLRSTKLRTVDRTTISIPNSSLSQLSIENIDTRDYIRLKTLFTLARTTSAETTRSILKETQDFIIKHALCDPASTRVQLVKIDTTGIQIEIITHVQTQDEKVMIRTREEILVAVIQIVAQNLGHFADVNAIPK